MPCNEGFGRGLHFVVHWANTQSDQFSKLFDASAIPSVLWSWIFDRYIDIGERTPFSFLMSIALREFRAT